MPNRDGTSGGRGGLGGGSTSSMKQQKKQRMQMKENLRLNEELRHKQPQASLLSPRGECCTKFRDLQLLQELSTANIFCVLSTWCYAIVIYVQIFNTPD